MRSSTRFYCDPWGTPDTDKGVYRVALDLTGGDQVVVNGMIIPNSVAVWSAGPDGIDFTPDDVTSWK